MVSYYFSKGFFYIDLYTNYILNLLSLLSLP